MQDALNMWQLFWDKLMQCITSSSEKDLSSSVASELQYKVTTVYVAKVLRICYSPEIWYVAVLFWLVWIIADFVHLMVFIFKVQWNITKENCFDYFILQNLKT